MLLQNKEFNHLYKIFSNVMLLSCYILRLVGYISRMGCKNYLRNLFMIPH